MNADRDPDAAKVRSDCDTLEALAGSDRRGDDYLTTATPRIESTTEKVERGVKSQSSKRGWEYRCSFERNPAALAASRENPGDPLWIEGRVGGVRFKITSPKYSSVGTGPTDESVDVTFWGSCDSYERYGGFENRCGAWVPIATTGVANPENVRRSESHAEAQVDWDTLVKSRAANLWTPVSTECDDVSLHTDIVCLVCILPESTSPRRIAKLASTYLDVSENRVEDAVPAIRAKLRNGLLCGPEVGLSDGTVWRFSPEWATEYRGGFHG